MHKVDLAIVIAANLLYTLFWTIRTTEFKLTQAGILLQKEGISSAES